MVRSMVYAAAAAIEGLGGDAFTTSLFALSGFATASVLGKRSVCSRLEPDIGFDVV